MTTEADEVAASIWRSRSMLEGNGLNTVAPIRSYSDAEHVALAYLGEQSSTVRSNVADILYDMARAAGTVR